MQSPQARLHRLLSLCYWILYFYLLTYLGPKKVVLLLTYLFGTEESRTFTYLLSSDLEFCTSTGKFYFFLSLNADEPRALPTMLPTYQRSPISAHGAVPPKEERRRLAEFDDEVPLEKPWRKLRTARVSM